MRVKHAHTHSHSQLTTEPCAISQLSAYSILHPKSHYMVSTIISLFVIQGREKQSRPHLNINIRSEIYSTQSGHELHSIYATETSHNPCLCSGNKTGHSQTDGRWLRLHLPLSCMTTPKCVLGVLSSGALGGTEMTGGLEGFLLEVVLFSERGKRKAGNKKTRPNRSSGLSVPPKAHGTAPDVGSGI